MSATRQLGIQHARGEFIAFLDADDIFLPHKLHDQVALLGANPEAVLLYGRTLYWHSWTGRAEHASRDYLPALGVPGGVSYASPLLLQRYLEGRASVPCTCSVLARRDVILRTGGFEAAFPGAFEDQVFYAKMCLAGPVLVSDKCWDKYRQHESSSTAASVQRAVLQTEYLAYLRWLESYLDRQKVRHRELRRALRRQLWLQRRWGRASTAPGDDRWLRWIRKWLLRFEAQLLPLRLRDWVWLRERGQ